MRPTVSLLECDGPTIPPETLGQIWENFYTTKSEGTGLGLSICRTITEAHQGRLDAANLDGDAGVRMTLVLPVADHKGALD